MSCEKKSPVGRLLIPRTLGMLPHPTSHVTSTTSDSNNIMSGAYLPSVVSSRHIAAEDLRELRSAYDGKRCILTLSFNSEWCHIIPHAWPSQEHLVSVQLL